MRGRSCVVGHAWSVMRGRSCVVGHAWSCVRGRSCVVGRAWSVMRGRSCVVGRAWSVVRGRSCVVGRAWSVVRGRAWSCVVVRGRAVLPASRPARQPALPCYPLRGQHCRDTNERTTSNNPLNPPGVGWVNVFYLFKVRVSIRTCVPNLGSFRRPCRKVCLSNL